MCRATTFANRRASALADSAVIYGAPRQPDLTGDIALGGTGCLEVANGDTCCRNAHSDLVATRLHSDLDIAMATMMFKLQESY